MKSSKNNPQPGTVLRFKDWRITVLRREGDQVTYRATHKDGYTKPDAACTLAQWKERAKGAKVVEEGLDGATCVATANVAAPCKVDGVMVVGEVHCLGLDLYCAGHCPAH
jgi:hypothetical protein